MTDRIPFLVKLSIVITAIFCQLSNFVENPFLVSQQGMLMSIPQCIVLEIPDTLRQLVWLRISGNSSEKLHCGNAVHSDFGHFRNFIENHQL